MVDDCDNWLDGFEFERQYKRTRVELIGGDGVVGRIDLAQTCGCCDFCEHVLG